MTYYCDGCGDELIVGHASSKMMQIGSLKKAKVYVDICRKDDCSEQAFLCKNCLRVVLEKFLKTSI